MSDWPLDACLGILGLLEPSMVPKASVCVVGLAIGSGSCRWRLPIVGLGGMLLMVSFASQLDPS